MKLFFAACVLAVLVLSSNANAKIVPPDTKICFEKYQKCCYKYSPCGYAIRKMKYPFRCDFTKCYKVCKRVCANFNLKVPKPACKKVKVPFKHCVDVKTFVNGKYVIVKKCFEKPYYKTVCEEGSAPYRKQLCKELCYPKCKYYKAKCIKYKYLKYYKFCPKQYCGLVKLIGIKSRPVMKFSHNITVYKTENGPRELLKA